MDGSMDGSSYGLYFALMFIDQSLLGKRDCADEGGNFSDSNCEIYKQRYLVHFWPSRGCG